MVLELASTVVCVAVKRRDNESECLSSRTDTKQCTLRYCFSEGASDVVRDSVIVTKDVKDLADNRKWVFRSERWALAVGIIR